MEKIRSIDEMEAIQEQVEDIKFENDSALNPKLYFEHKNSQIFEVKIRTWKQIYKYLRSYISEKELGKYSYIEETQRISKANGNIYADFINSETGDKHSFCIADYEDYIDEIKN